MPEGLATNVNYAAGRAHFGGGSDDHTTRPIPTTTHQPAPKSGATGCFPPVCGTDPTRSARHPAESRGSWNRPRMQPGALLARTTPQVILTFGGQKRLRHEKHQPTEDVRAPQWRRYEERRPGLQPASDPECIREATRRAREGAVAACGLGAALTATAEGKVVTNSEVDTYQYVGQREDKQAENNVHIQFYCVHA